MKSKLLRILRREAEKKIQVKEFLSAKGKWRFCVTRNGWSLKTYSRYSKAMAVVKRLRRAYILDKLQKLK